MSDHPPLKTSNEEKETVTAARFVLTAGDVELFKLLHAYRFLRREHLSALTGRPAKRLHRRLLKLVENGYVAVLRLPVQKHIYVLAKAALTILVEHGVGDIDLLSQRLRTHELKELFLKHELMLVDLHAILDIATRDGVLRLIDWREGRELYDTVNVSDYSGVTRLPVRPDAFLHLKTCGGRRAQTELGFFWKRIDQPQPKLVSKRRSEPTGTTWNRGCTTRNTGLKTFAS